MPKVSVIIPSYNHAKYVAEAIQSVLEQTYQDFEIVITDDGSQDNTVDIIKNFNDPRIRLFCFSKNQGAAVAANHCIAEAKGEFIALLNSDDAWVTDKLEKQVKFLDEHPEIGAVFSYAQFIDENSQPIKDVHKLKYNNFIQTNKTRYEWLNYFFYYGNCLCHPSILIRKQCYEMVGYYDRRLAQLPDFEFWIRLCQKYEIYIMPESLIKFRIRDNEANISGNKPESYYRMYLELPQVYQNYLNAEFDQDILKIFPELINQYSIDPHELNQDLLFFGIAKIALNHSLVPIRFFGIDAIYKIFKDSNHLDQIQKIYNFNFSDLIKIAGKHPIFVSQDILEQAALFKNSRFWNLWNKWLNFKQKLNPVLSLLNH